jgi:hypothetical protein
MRRAVFAVLACAAHARASPWSVTAEAGASIDTNVERVETGPGLDTSPVLAPVSRLGVRADGRGDLLGGAYAVGLSDLTRTVIGSTPIEDVTLLAADVRWVHPVGDRPIGLGFGLIGADALPLADPVGARTFSNVGGDLLVTSHAGDERRFVLAIGGRAFTYKPDHLYDWSGPTTSARLDLVLWQPSGHTRSLELAATAGFEARAYNSDALVNTCSPGMMPGSSCPPAPTDLARRDRYEHVGLELTWVGRQVITIGYQLAVIDSNSYGESLARHRATLSATTGLPWGLYGTALVVVQIDQYLDGLVISSDVQHHDFANIEDENRSSIQLRLARKLTPGWSVEARAAYWRNLGSSVELGFERALFYGGVVYTR